MRIDTVLRFFRNRGDRIAENQAAEFVRAGDSARDARQWSAAAAAYARYLAIQPDNFGIWVQLGHAAKELGDSDESDRAYSQALRLRPRDADLLLNIGHLRKLQGRPQEAISFYRRSYEIDHNAYAAHELQSEYVNPPAPSDEPVLSPPPLAEFADKAALAPSNNMRTPKAGPDDHTRLSPIPVGDQEDLRVWIIDPEIVTMSVGPTTPHFVDGGSSDNDISADSSWYEATFIPSRQISEHGLTLSGNGPDIPVLLPVTARIEMRTDYGHSFVLNCDTELDATVFINGHAQLAIHLRKGETLIRLPTSCFNGEVAQIQIRDTTGSQVLYETATLVPNYLTPLEVLQREAPPPYPATLSNQSAFRFAGLRGHIANNSDHDVTAQLDHALNTLEGGYARVKLAPLVFPVIRQPDVSVVIPAHNKIEATYSCFCALLLAWNRVTFEVILVDDGSTDDTTSIESLVSGITVVRHAEPQRFVRACNAGAAKARGRFVAILNNDTEPTAGWLDALVDAFGRFDRVGMAGSKLLFPDGKLQDAGGIIWGSGNPWNYGSKANPWDPRYSYARQADYLSGAAFLTTREIWQRLGGFSNYLEPMYFEDTDFAFKVREAGLTTWFVPSSIVYHHEGTTSGTDTSKGFKRFQEVNRPKFKRRWARAFSQFGREGIQPDIEKDRGITGRILCIDYTTPRPDADGGGYAAWQEIRLLQSLGFKVTFLPENLAHFGQYTSNLQKQGVECIYAPFFLSPVEFLERRGSEFDAVYITRYHVAENLLAQVRAVNPGAKVLMCNADLHFLREARTALASGDPSRLAEANKVREREIAIMRKVDVVLSYTDVEHTVIQSHTPGTVNVMKCPWVVDIPPRGPEFHERSGLSFLGGFGHPPNAEAIDWFAREVMLPLGGIRPDIMLSIYGARMSPEIKALRAANIEPVGFVENQADAYRPHRIFVAPLQTGAGIKGKVLSALSYGVPCVLSPIAAEGIGLRDGHDCLIARTSDEWVTAIMRLYDDVELWEKLSANARDYVAKTCSFEQGRKEMSQAFESIGMFLATS